MKKVHVRIERKANLIFIYVRYIIEIYDAVFMWMEFVAREVVEKTDLDSRESKDKIIAALLQVFLYIN